MRVSRNKNALKQQRDQLAMYRRFLPSLDLKRQQLLTAWKQAREELASAEQAVRKQRNSLTDLLSLLGSSTLENRDLSTLVQIESVQIEQVNVVGTRVPRLQEVIFQRAEYSTLALPFWVDLLLDSLEQTSELELQLQTSVEREQRIADAARKITQRVNLFEKVLIPNALENIKRIGIALSDEERSAVVRSKLAKQKHQR